MDTFDKLDKVDLQILRTLQENARLTTKELAARVSLSSTPVFERLKRLESGGYIKKYIAVLDAEKLNQGFVVFCSVKLRRLNRDIAAEFTRIIQDIPEVTECYNISGSYDYLLKIHAPNMKYYQEFILNVLGTIDSLGSLESTFVMAEVKHRYENNLVHLSDNVQPNEEVMILNTKIYPRSNDYQTVYLNAVVRNPAIVVGDYTIYNDFVNDPTQFEKNNVLYHYPVNGDRLVIGKFCSIACGAKFLFNSANHTLNSLSNYPFPIFFEEWQLDKKDVASAWDNKGDIVIGSDVWIGYEAVIMAGVHVGDGAIIASRAVVTKDVPPYTIVGGMPAKEIRMRFDKDTVDRLQELQWWNWNIEKITRYLPHIMSGKIDELMK